MARPAKKQAQQKFEEPDEAEGWEDAVVDPDDKEGQNLRLRDWRDVERFREMKDLRRLVDDDYGLEEIFHIPVKPRTDLGIPAPHTPPGKPGKAGAAPTKPVPVAGKNAKEAPKVMPAKASHAPAKAAHGNSAHHGKNAHAKAAHKPAAKAAAHKAPKAKAKRK